MEKTLIATIPEPHILGQSIGCTIPLDGEMSLGKLAGICTGLSKGPNHDRVDINLSGNRSDSVGVRLSVAFHLQPNSRPIRGEPLSRRANMLQQWIDRKFGAREFDKKEFPNRIEFCRCMETPLVAM